MTDGLESSGLPLGAMTARRRLLSAGGLFVAGSAVGAASFREPTPPPRWTTTGELSPSGFDDTAALQQALDEHAVVRLTSGPFRIRSVRFNTGNRLVMAPSTVLRAIELRPGEMPAMLLVDHVEDVVVEGGILDGEGGPVTLGLAIYGGRRVRVLGTRAVNLATTHDGQKGDGFYLARSVNGPNKRIAEDVVFDGVTADGTGRQGLSVIAVRGLRVANSSFVNTRSGVPGAGIDFEPNRDADTIDDVVVSGCTFAGNETGVLFYLKNDERLTGVTLRDCTFHENRAHGVNGGALRGGDKIWIHGCRFERNGSLGIMLGQANSVSVVDCTVRDHESGRALEIDDTPRSVVRGNFVDRCEGGIAVGGLGRPEASTAIINGNHVWDCAGPAVRVVAGGSPIHAVLTDNVFGNSEGGTAQTAGVRTEGDGATVELRNNRAVGHPEQA